MIDDHIRDDNEELKSCIMTWLKPLKWHQEWDWESVSEGAMFGDSAPRIDIFWESEDYEASEVFKLTPIWSKDTPNHADNVREILAAIPGNEQLQDDLDRELVESGSTTVNGTPTKNESFTLSTSPSVAPDPATPIRTNWKGKISPVSMSKATRYTNSFATPRATALNTNQVLRPDQPIIGTNRVAFENFFQSSGRKKRPVRDYQFGRRSKSKRIKTAHAKKLAKNAKKIKPTKKVTKRRPKAKKKSASKKKRDSSKPKHSKRRTARKKTRASTKKSRRVSKRKSKKRTGKNKRRGRR